jgi:hypothetical protein
MPSVPNVDSREAAIASVARTLKISMFLALMRAAYFAVGVTLKLRAEPARIARRSRHGRKGMLIGCGRATPRRAKCGFSFTELERRDSTNEVV